MAVALERRRVGGRSASVEHHAELPFSFTGRAGEYFGIWIVNILLSIVTLGIYSAWAKVRDKRYFYGNTRLNGSSFAYLASPIQILKGRLIVFGFFVLYAFCSSYYPSLIWVFVLAMFIITPWAVVKAYSFNARHSSYRNIRFNFTGGTMEAAGIYVLQTILIPFTLGLLIPYNAFRMKQFFIDHSQFGQAQFQFDGTKGAFYRIYVTAFLIFLPAFAGLSYLVGMISFAIVEAQMTTLREDVPDEEAIAMMLKSLLQQIGPYLGLLPLLLGATIILMVLAYSYLSTSIQNYVVNNTRLAGPQRLIGHRLSLNLSIWQVLWIRLSNLVLIALTFGLMIPWAKIRMARYQIEQMSLIPGDDLETLVGEEQARTSALGDEFGEGMDLDLGLGV